ncbi:MAG: site-specific DNA-methyltransferase [Candidatus Saganbacteria bacterium]|nr:site-specific DNA-methyltransferase [Candidatus Saganbacteria bacterium]
MANDVKKLQYIKKHSCGSLSSRNMIIHGDNNIVLDMLRERWQGDIKCIYIDPPYNNREQYNHYQDDKSHEDWVLEMTNIISKLRGFLREDGSLWVSIDESEMHYLKVASDLVFGRQNYITTIIWQQRTTRENRKIFSNNHEYILVYAKNPKKFKAARNMLPPTKDVHSRYKNPDSDPRGPWQSVSANVQAGHAVNSQFYELIAPNGKKHRPPNGRCWIYNKNRMNREIRDNNIWFGANGNGVPRIKKFISNSKVGVTPETLWLSKDVGTTKMAKKHLLSLFPDSLVFDTPKPESLIKRILEIATNEGDLFMDVFLGSGTSAAVAHKMKRKYIGVELGEHVIDYAVFVPIFSILAPQ